MPNGHQRYYCLNCQQTFSECFDTLYYWRRVSPEQVQQVLQAHSEGSSLRGMSRITGLAYNTVVSIVRAASAKAQLVHNDQVEQVQTEEVSVDELWSFVQKNIHQCLCSKLAAGDCWIGMSLANFSGLILAARVGKHTDGLIEELVVSTEGKTDCKQWNSDDWGGYERVLPPEILHHIGKDKTQRLERTNGIVRQQSGRWHRRQNMRDWRGNPSSANSRKFGKLWEQTDCDNSISRQLLQLVWAA